MFVAEVSKYFRCLNSPTYSRIFDQLFEENIVAVQLYCEQATDWSKNEVECKGELARHQSLL